MVDTRADYPNLKYARRQGLQYKLGHVCSGRVLFKIRGEDSVRPSSSPCESARSFSVKKSLNRAVPAVWTLLLRQHYVELHTTVTGALHRNYALKFTGRQTLHSFHERQPCSTTVRTGLGGVSTHDVQRSAYAEIFLYLEKLPYSRQQKHPEWNGTSAPNFEQGQKTRNPVKYQKIFFPPYAWFSRGHLHIFCEKMDVFPQRVTYSDMFKFLSFKTHDF